MSPVPCMLMEMVIQLDERRNAELETTQRHRQDTGYLRWKPNWNLMGPTIEREGAADRLAPNNMWYPTCKHQPRERTNTKELVRKLKEKKLKIFFISITPLSLIRSE